MLVGVIWEGFEGFGPFFGNKTPQPPHLGEISQKKTVFFLDAFPKSEEKENDPCPAWQQSVGKDSGLDRGKIKTKILIQFLPWPHPQSSLASREIGNKCLPLKG